MAVETVEVEAESLEEAREQIISQIPEGLHLLSEQVISDGKPKTVEAVGDTIDAAFAKVQRDNIPDNAEILENREIASEQKIMKTVVEEFDEESAKSSADMEARQQSSNPITFQSIALISVGNKGILGIGKKPNQYEVELLELQPAAVKVTYKTKAKVIAQVGESNTPLSAENPTIVQSQTASKGDIMSEELITVDNVSKEFLESIFSAAFMDVTHDNDGDIVVKDACSCIVMPSKESKKILLFCQFTFKPSASDNEKLVCANNINSEYMMVRAFVLGNILRFSYDIVLNGGITKKALVLIVKRFASIPHVAVEDHGQGLLE
ncbi:MAG: YbjN domain-containing protein [Desulfobulbaceae bacterium]|nr:YbjN domain-containing protein [Desulfobulbaceae bacterium]